jgi:uncharacterized protein YeaO (DUF488 family)
MAIRIVRLGTARARGEGLRLGTVRRPPRGVPKADFAKRDFYDLWYPNLAPSEPLLKIGLQAQAHEDDEAAWKRFARGYRKEMQAPERKHDIALLAALSQGVDFSVGCYCANEARCHRSLLRELLHAAGAKVVD